MKYEVGQIIFMCSSKSIQVVPLRVVEKIIRKNLSGIETTYTVQFPDNNGTKADISKLKGKVFPSAESVKTFMINNSIEAIEKMVKAADHLKKEVFGEQIDPIQVDDHGKDTQQLSSETAFVDLGEGMKAKINLGEFQKINAK